jgi:endonuclease/exonuclease/phosphatase family metal-dependent hydrolase
VARLEKVFAAIDKKPQANGCDPDRNVMALPRTQSSTTTNILPRRHYWRNSWSRNAGLRIDHLLLSSDLAHRLLDAGVDREIRGRKDASDHAPTWIELRSKPTKSKKRR